MTKNIKPNDLSGNNAYNNQDLGSLMQKKGPVPTGKYDFTHDSGSTSSGNSTGSNFTFSAKPVDNNFKPA